VKVLSTTRKAYLPIAPTSSSTNISFLTSDLHTVLPNNATQLRSLVRMLNSYADGHTIKSFPKHIFIASDYKHATHISTVVITVEVILFLEQSVT
jgi:hypothetical protein